MKHFLSCLALWRDGLPAPLQTGHTDFVFPACGAASYMDNPRLPRTLLRLLAAAKTEVRCYKAIDFPNDIEIGLFGEELTATCRGD